ncbi:unnamed protein product [Ectocarpus sp. CCAP 1310/34]|nr:unnamed protein product [Ectocarpus sp. CCAP 1310/34]
MHEICVTVSSGEPSPPQQSVYRWCCVEQVDQAEPRANRSNGWRYVGPRGVTYRPQAVFGAGYRVLGSDQSLENFQSWARRKWRRGLVHPRDADAWNTAFIDVEGGGRGQLVVSAADDTWRTILCWGSAGREIEVDHEGIPTSLSNLQVRAGIDSPSPSFRQLNIASFGNRVGCRPCNGIIHDLDRWWTAKGEGATEPLRNALDGGYYFRNLYSVLLGRDVGSEEFDTWLAGVNEPPPLTLRNLEQWLSMTKANVVVWSHRGSGDNVLGPVDEKTNLRPPALHVGVREGHVYRLEVDGPRRDRFGSSLDVAIENSVRTQRRFRRIAEAVEEEEEPDTTGCGSRTFLRATDIEKEIMSMSRLDKDHDPQSAQKRKRGTDASAFTTWYSPPGTALDELMLHLHIRGISCRGKLTNYRHWDSLTLPSHGITIRTWCPASVGGLDPNDFRPCEATRLIELQNALASPSSPLSRYAGGPIVGAEQASGTSYGPEDWQCDINGAHTAALLSMHTVSVFAHMDEVQEIDAVMVTGSNEALAVGGKVVPVLGEVQHVKAGLRTGDKELGFEPLATGDAHLRFEAKRTWFGDGFWALGEEILDQTRLHVLEVRNALESCGASDFSYQCDAVFFKGSPAVQDEMRLRFGHLFSGELNTPGTLKFCPAMKNPQTSESRVFHGIETKLSLGALPPALRQIPCPPKRVLRVVPLWDGIGTSFPSMDDTHRAWLLSPKTKNYRFGRSVKAADHQLGIYMGDDSHVKKTAGSIRTLKADVIIIEEAAYMPLRTLSMILAAAHCNGTHVIGTYDTHQLQPVEDSSGMSTSRDNVDRRVVLEKAFPICFHLFARKRDKTIEEQVEMDDGLLYFLGAGADRHMAQTRAIERFDCGGSTYHHSPSDFHLAYTRDCARFHAFRGLLGCNELGDWDSLGHAKLVGAQYRDLGKSGKIHKNHIYSVVRSSADTVVVASAFDDGASLGETSLCRAEAENLFDPPGSCTVHAVQGRTVEGKLVIHQAPTGPSNVSIVEDVHRSKSNMSDRERVSWVSRKVSSYIYADVTAGRLGPDEGMQHREALLAEDLLNSYGGRCCLCSCELVWAVYSERQPTLDRLDCSLPNIADNVDVKCLRCNRARGSQGRGRTKKKKKISMCAKWLEEHENPSEVLDVLRKLHPGSLNKNVRRVREVWIQAFGARHNAGPVKIEIRRLLALIKKKSSAGKKTKGRKEHLKQLQKAWGRVVSFEKLDLTDNWSARRAIHLRTVSFTGLAEIDDLLRKVRLLPPYVSRPSDFHLAYTRDCARFHAFRGLLGCNELGDWDSLGHAKLVGAQYRDLGKSGKIHKNHIYSVVRSSADTVVVASAFDDGASLGETSLCRAEAENLFDPPGSCTVHAVQGRTVEGKLVIHQAPTGPSNVSIVEDVHRSKSNMSDRERVSWVSRKVSSYIYADVTAGRLGPDEGMQHREALLAEDLLNSYGGRCCLCSCELVWAVYSERQPTLDRLDCSLPNIADNVDVKCLRCNRARGSQGRGRTKKKKKISMCAKWLEEHENPSEVLDVLRKLHPGSLNKNVRRVREVWIQAFGARHNAGPVKIEIRRLLALIKKKSSAGKKTKGRKEHLKQLQKAWGRVVSFEKLDLTDNWSARRAIHLRTVSFTGLAEIDDLLRKVRLLPPYVSRLELTPEEKSLPRIKRRESL